MYNVLRGQLGRGPQATSAHIRVIVAKKTSTVSRRIVGRIMGRKREKREKERERQNISLVV